MPDFVLQRPESAVGWQLRGALAAQRTVRLVLSDRCDGVHPTESGERILEGTVQRVAATDAYCIIRGRHVPLSEVLAVHRPHYEQGPASDPSDPMDVTANYLAEPLSRRRKR
jgi:hypothetical protein